MLNKRLFFACAGLFALTTACTTTMAVSDTREADVKAVMDTEAAWSNDAATKDLDKIVGYYAEDASLLMPNEPIVIGRDKIKETFRPFLADPNFALRFVGTHAEASKGGDLVYSVGTYSMTMSNPTAKDQKITDKGKYLTVYRKQADGTWKAAADMINSDMPAMGSSR